LTSVTLSKNGGHDVISHSEVMPAGEWTRSYAAPTVSFWSIVHTYLLDQENITYH